jgi:hypothetical protein
MSYVYVTYLMVSSVLIVLGDILKNYLIVLLIVEYLQVSKKQLRMSYVKFISQNKTTSNVLIVTIDLLIYQGQVNRSYRYDD